ncbi:hypothetical protein, partial [Neisseria meningitidis]|uniref:hypothetical protein n=1 Tax=Neisseria meningitidis TaxID=487 RepID=UPI00406303E2
KEKKLCRLKVFQTASVSLTQEGIPSIRKPAPRHSYEPTSRHSHESGNPGRKISRNRFTR